MLVCNFEAPFPLLGFLLLFIKLICSLTSRKRVLNDFSSEAYRKKSLQWAYWKHPVLQGFPEGLPESLSCPPCPTGAQWHNDFLSDTNVCALLCRIHGRTLMLYLLRDLEALSCALFLAAPQGGDYLWLSLDKSLLVIIYILIYVILPLIMMSL